MVLSVHSTTCNRRGLGISPSSSGGGTGRKSGRCPENVFRTPRQSLLRDHILSSISKGFYLSPSGKTLGVLPPRAVLPGGLEAAMASAGTSSSCGPRCPVSILKAGGPLGSNLPKRKPCEFVGSIGLNRPWGHSVRESAYMYQVPVLGATC